MVNLLETLYALTAISAVITLVMMWRQRKPADASVVRRTAPAWAGVTVALACACVALYWYLGPR